MAALTLIKLSVQNVEIFKKKQKTKNLFEDFFFGEGK